MNIADLLLHGCTPKQMLNSKWGEGPIWLKENPEFWPVSEESVDEELGGEESNSNNVTDNENNITCADAVNLHPLEGL
ncbi:hypothetical protein NPIL_449931 [Nephila pilipes]|uniref:Uncharacterized protein n=1 Tax=Nephila pilipes TaxID=299642 RepID=A0A8X6NUU0_NEPPI|nr:hypothetical protein NPIL_449931 [Nephila pilipes]